MARIRALGGVVLTALLLAFGCGRTETDNGLRAAGGAESPAGDVSFGGECAGGAPADGGCGGEAGERALEPYARLHTACGQHLEVNRGGRGAPVCFRLR